jgi:hypothetical protein
MRAFEQDLVENIHACRRMKDEDMLVVLIAISIALSLIVEMVIHVLHDHATLNET